MKLRLAWQVFTLELRKILSYRVDFWTNFIGVVICEFAVAYFLWRAIYDYRDVDMINGFTFPGMMLYYLLVPIIGHIVQAQVMHFISEEIYNGSLNRYLIYPLSFFAYKYVSHLAFSLMGVLQLFLVLTIYVLAFDVPGDIKLTGVTVVQCLIAGWFATTLYFLVASCLEMVAFWADNIWSLLAMLRISARLLGGGLIPLAFFPDWSVEMLRILPFYFFTAFPVEAALGHLSFADWVSALALATMWILVFSGLAYAIWQRGKLRYTGVGI